MTTGQRNTAPITMRYSWLVAAIFTLQTVLLGAPICDCIPQMQARQVAEHCAESEGPCCCSITTLPDKPSDPATVVTAPTVQFIATVTDAVRLAADEHNPTAFRPIADPHPSSQWSAFVCAERAPPLS